MDYLYGLFVWIICMDYLYGLFVWIICSQYKTHIHTYLSTIEILLLYIDTNHNKISVCIYKRYENTSINRALYLKF